MSTSTKRLLKFCLLLQVLLILTNGITSQQKQTTTTCKGQQKDGICITTPPPAPSTKALSLAERKNDSYTGVTCTPSERSHTSCLNGGKCYIVIIDNARMPACHCRNEYIGKNCHEFNVDNFDHSLDGSATLSIFLGPIVGGLTGSVALVTLIVIIICCRRNCNKSPHNKAKKGNANGEGINLMNHTILELNGHPKDVV